MNVDVQYLILGLIVWAIIGWLVRYALGFFEVPAQLSKLIQFLVVVLFIFWLLNAFGVFLSPIHFGRSTP